MCALPQSGVDMNHARAKRFILPCLQTQFDAEDIY